MFSALEGIGIRAPMKTNNRTSAGEAGSHVSFRWARTAFAGGKEHFTSSWCWATFGERSMVISLSPAPKSRPPASAFAPCKPLEREGLLC